MKTCCFIGHRNTRETPELLSDIINVVTSLIVNHNVATFLFGSASHFDDLCLKIVTQLKNTYPDIKLIYVRSCYPTVEGNYKNYLLKSYDDTIMPTNLENAGKSSYVKRNQEMIKLSDFCVFYYNKEYKPNAKKYSKSSLTTYQPKSGTKLAFEYARKANKKIINLCK